MCGCVCVCACVEGPRCFVHTPRPAVHPLPSLPSPPPISPTPAHPHPPAQLAAEATLAATADESQVLAARELAAARLQRCLGAMFTQLCIAAADAAEPRDADAGAASTKKKPQKR